MKYSELLRKYAQMLDDDYTNNVMIVIEDLMQLVLQLQNVTDTLFPGRSRLAEQLRNAALPVERRDPIPTRGPTSDEMVKGISKAVYKKLDLMEYGPFASRPRYAWPDAFQKAVEAFLEEHKVEIISRITSRRIEEG